MAGRRFLSQTRRQQDDTTVDAHGQTETHVVAKRRVSSPVLFVQPVS